MKVTLVGHSTVIVESGGQRILFDPWFGRGNLAYRRLEPPGLTRAQVGRVDAVFLSHTHFDHFDRAYLHSLPAEVPLFAPVLGRFWAMLKAGRRIRPLSRWESIRLGEVEVTAVPARHVGPTLGYVVRHGESALYFAGDTYYGRFMAEIARRFHPQVCLIPVATFRLPLTMGNGGAVQATRTLGPRLIIPIHLGITPRSPLLRRKEDASTFREQLQAAGLRTEVRVLRPGEYAEL